MTETNNLEKLERLKKYAKLLDSQFKIPGTNFSFGIDPILNLFPILGSFSGFITSSFMIFMAHKQGVSGRVKAMMLKNSLFDYIFGLIPIYGTIKDFFYKSNQKNMVIIEEHLIDQKHQGSGKSIILTIVLVAIGLFVLSIFLFIFILGFVVSLF